MEKLLKASAPVVIGVLIAGAIMHYGRDLPGIAQAHGGFDS